MRAILLTTITILLGASALIGQVTLRNSATDKTRTLKADGHISLGIPFEGPELACGYRLLNGKLQDTQRGLIRVLPVDEEKTMEFNNGLAKKERVRYGNIKGLPLIALPIADVGHIAYRKKGAEGLSRWGAIVTTLGAFSALVVAPLTSIDYSEGTFNSDNYFRWAGYSLGATGVGVSMLIGSKQRHYQIMRPGQPADNKLWIIEK